MNKLTFGMCAYDDFDGVYFTIQANRLLNPVLQNDAEILVIDNNPHSAKGKLTKEFCERIKSVRYIPFTERVGTAVRGKIFEFASAEIVICVDCHVLLYPGAVDAAVQYLQGAEQPTLLQGPMVSDSLELEMQQWLDAWARGMHGLWSQRRPLSDPAEPAVEITNMGLGAFASRKADWPGFNPLFRGFGGEEGYIHRKYISRGGRAVSLPAFKWAHRFFRVKEPYPCRERDIIFNYLVGCFELNECPDRIIEHFSMRVGSTFMKILYEEARSAFLDSQGS